MRDMQKKRKKCSKEESEPKGTSELSNTVSPSTTTEEISFNRECEKKEQAVDLISCNQSRRAVYRAVGKVRPNIPESPETYLKFMKSLTKTTPRKRKALVSEGFVLNDPPSKKRKLLFKDMTDKSTEPLKKELYKNRRKRSHEYLRRRRLIAHVLHKSAESQNTVSRHI